MFFEVILWIVFVGSSIMLSVVILLQEAKGGGLAEAFGGMGAQTFGVKASGINRFTAYVGIVFFLTCILITCARKDSTSLEFAQPDPAGQEAPALPGVGGTGDPGDTGPTGTGSDPGTGDGE